MTKLEAMRIRELKKGCTYRRLAEIWWPDPQSFRCGNQEYGKDLCTEAFNALYPGLGGPDKVYNIEIKEIEKLYPNFKNDNRSYMGDFYWWE